SFMEFTQLIIQLRKQYPITQASWHWFQANGQTMDPCAPESINVQCLGCVSSENKNAAFLILWNSGDQTCDFTLPGNSRNWKVLLDTSAPEPADSPSSGKSLNTLNIASRSLKVLTGTKK
ncbi:MAG: hypothetical protein V3T45_02380, partial [Nitrospinaceae bacterium]